MGTMNLTTDIPLPLHMQQAKKSSFRKEAKCSNVNARRFTKTDSNRSPKRS